MLLNGLQPPGRDAGCHRLRPCQPEPPSVARRTLQRLESQTGRQAVAHIADYYSCLQVGEVRYVEIQTGLDAGVGNHLVDRCGVVDLLFVRIVPGAAESFVIVGEDAAGLGSCVD